MSNKQQTVSPASSTPEFAFVLNRERGPRTLLVPKRDREGKRLPGAIAHDMKILGPGMNYVATSVLAEAEHQIVQFAGQLEVCDPTKVPEVYAIDYAKHTSSRQAAKRWLEIETRPKVRAALTERLAKRPSQRDASIE